MTLGVCTECAGALSSEALRCPHCGAVTPAGRDQQTRRRTMVRVILALLLLAGIVWYGYFLATAPDRFEKEAQRQNCITAYLADGRDLAQAKAACQE